MASTAKPRRGRWRTVGTRVLILVAGGALLLPALVFLGLRTPAVRAAILSRVAGAVEARTGVELAARDFRLDLLGGVLEVEALALTAHGHDDAVPFLTVARTHAVIHWRTLFTDRPRIESLSFENPRLDLRAPLPDFEAEPDSSDSAIPLLEILAIDVSGGAVFGSPAPDGIEIWLDTWRAEGIRLRGEYRSGSVGVDEAFARLFVDSHRRKTLDLEIGASLSGDVDTGVFAVDSLRIRGDGLTLDARGQFEAAVPTANAAFELDLDPARLFPDLTSSGRARGDGELQLARSPDLVLSGLLRIDAADIPAELAGPWLDGVDVRGPLDPTGTRLDIDVDFDFAIALEREEGSEPDDRLLGNADLTWRRDAEPLLTASVRSLAPADDRGVQLAFAGELTPAAPGRRRFSGELQAPGWIDLLGGTLRSTRIDLDEPDLAQAVRRIGLDPSALPAWWPRGGVTASLHAEGPATAPRLRLDARLDHGDEVLAKVSARTLDGDAPLHLSCDASLFPEAPGRRELSGELLAPGWHRIREGELRDARVVVELDELPRALLPEAIPAELIRGRLSARVGATGSIMAPDLRVDANWAPGADESVRLEFRGRPSADFPFFESGGVAELTVRNLNLPSFGDLVSLEGLQVEATTDGNDVEFRDLSGTLVVDTPAAELGGRFTANGRFDLPWPPRRIEAQLAIERPFEGVDKVETLLRVEEGTLRLERTKVAAAGTVASLQATIPFGLLTGIADGPISVEVSNVDLPTVAGLFDPAGALPPLHGVVDASLTFDPEDPIASVGWLTVSGVGADVQGETVEVGRLVRIEMANARIVLPRTLLEPTGGVIRGSVPLELSAVVDLAPGWKPGDELAALVEGFSVDLDGTVDASLLNPYLAGGSAVGEVTLAVDAKGSMEDVVAEIRIRGPNAAVFYRHPYPTRLEALEVDLSTRGGEVTLTSARARLNGGDAEMTGTFTPEDGLDATLRFDRVHYRLEFGIATQLGGELQIDWPLEGRQRLAGRIVVERAVLRRPIALNREALRVVFDFRPEAGANQTLETIDLDLSVLTDEGILIKNNVANLHADWGQLQITGTAADPRLEGRADVQPGGIVTVFGLVYRIDEASFEWFGDPAAEPRWVLDWTSHLDDPTIIQNWRNEFFTPADLGPGRGGILDSRGQALAGSDGGTDGGGPTVVAGMAAQATSAHRTQLTFEPLPLFGETDTQARYTLSQDLSQQLSFIASTNPREAEAQTYILDMHQLPILPSFRAQLFYNDRKNTGLTIQQTLKLGARPESDRRERRLGSKTIDAPESVPKRRLRRAIGYRKSDPFPAGAALDVEVDVGDAMRRKGYPAAAVEVDPEQTGKNRVDLLVTVDPGTRVSFVFEGDKIPSGVRRSIISAYRPVELGEQASLEEVQSETVQALNGLGYLEPQVDVDAAPADPADPQGPRIVRVFADGGTKVSFSQLVVEGLPDEDAARVIEIFGTTLSRVKLTQESPVADAQLLRALNDRGYPRARIAERSLSDDGETLVVRIDAGERQRLISIEIEGLSDADRARVAELVELREGDPFRTDRIGREARSIERDLRERGHADARVRARIEPVTEDRPLEVALTYDVDPGPSYRIEEVRFEGLRSSRPSWVKKVAGLEPGEVYRQSDVAEARGRLYRTGVFKRIRASSATEEEGSADTVVNFEFEEARRWRLAYGGRWEEGRGLSVVVDALNQHSLGRGHLSGVRGIYGGEDQSLRFYHVVPRVVGERSSLELFIEGKRENLDSRIKLRSTEAWAQLTFPLTRRIQNRPYIRFQDPELTLRDSGTGEPLDQRVISPLVGYQLAFDAQRRQIGEQRRQGIFIGVDLLGSHEALGSDVTTLGMVNQLKYFLPIGHTETGRFTWAQFWRGGLTAAKGQSVPLVDRFRAGGEFSVRGYPVNSLGPLGPEGLPLGGELLFIVNQEFHADLFRTESFGSVSALVFFDAGNVWLDRSTLDADLFKSVGLGARYLSPFGPFRLDFAVPLDRRPGDPSSKLYFGFGSVF